MNLKADRDILLFWHCEMLLFGMLLMRILIDRGRK
jgi:hypothetical protein